MNAIIVFTRVPVAGKTKTRLMKVFSASFCRDLHMAMLKDLHRSVCSLGENLLVYYTPGGDPGILKELLPFAVDFRKQRGADLGERMHRALSEALEEYEKVLLLGSDVAELEPELLRKAFSLLDDHQVVLGPSADGGYYLVGLKKAQPALFTDKTYSTPHVLREAILEAQRRELKVGLLPILHDIDEPEEVFMLKRRLKKEGATKDLLEGIHDF